MVEQTPMQTATRKYLGDVGAIRGALGFDELRLTAYLESAVPGFRGPVRFEQFDGG